MSSELRRSFHDDLGDLHGRVDGMAAVVTDGIRSVTSALLRGDAQAAERVVAADAGIDVEYEGVEAAVFQLVAKQAPVARDLRFLIATLRVAQEIERSGDLVASVGRRVARLNADALTPAIRTLLEEMGEQAADMFAAAAASYVVLDAEVASALPARDDVVDELQVRLLRELFASTHSDIESIVELGLIARFYERVADHAVVIAERVCFVVSGSMNAGDADERGF